MNPCGSRDARPEPPNGDAPEARVLEIFELGADGRYVIALTAADGAHPVPGCEGLVLDLDALWAEVDRLPETGAPPV